MIFKLILGAIMIVLGINGRSFYSPVLFVEGMIIFNSGIFSFRKNGRSIEHL